MVNAVEMKKICKYFESVRANYNVDLEIHEGEIHALLGENGAGKTTLMNILYGLYTPTSGEIFLRGEKVEIPHTRRAIELGIGMVHQHFMLIPALSVIENVVLGLKTPKSPMLDLNAAAQKLKELAESYHMDVEPWAKVASLSVGQQQRVEILKAMYRGANILVLDEPTAVLTPQETEELFSMMRKLKADGKTIIFISHKFSEVMTICDRISVLRGGELMSTLETADTDRNKLAHLLVGREISLEYDKNDAVNQSREVLKCEHIRYVNSQGIPLLKDITLTVHSAEVVGICGVDGNGQSELAEVITGMLSATEGTIFLMDEDITHQRTKEIMARNVAHIPQDRHKHGCVLAMDLTENILLMNYRRKGFHRGQFLHWKYINSFASDVIKKYQVKTAGMRETISNLSGGNQQKVVLGRELERQPDLLIAMHPTRGLDVGATEYIHKNILNERDRGAAVLLVSTELDELYSLCDRIAVIYEGEFMGIVTPEIEVHELGLMMAGTKYCTPISPAAR